MLFYMDEKITGKFTYKLPPAWEEKLEEIAKLARRKRSETARLMFGRALEMYEIDGKISNDLPPLPRQKHSAKKGEAS